MLRVWFMTYPENHLRLSNGSRLQLPIYYGRFIKTVILRVGNIFFLMQKLINF